jgi:hypothetical protein
MIDSFLFLFLIVDADTIQCCEQREGVSGGRSDAADSAVWRDERRVFRHHHRVGAVLRARPRQQSEPRASPHDRSADTEDAVARVPNDRLSLHGDQRRRGRVGAHLLPVRRRQDDDDVPAHRTHRHWLVVRQAVPLGVRQTGVCDRHTAAGARQHRAAHRRGDCAWLGLLRTLFASLRRFDAIVPRFFYNVLLLRLRCFCLSFFSIDELERRVSYRRYPLLRRHSHSSNMSCMYSLLRRFQFVTRSRCRLSGALNTFEKLHKSMAKVSQYSELVCCNDDFEFSFL